MVLLRQTTRDELEIFDAIDRQSHAIRFITQIGVKAHQDFFDDPNITYLTIVNEEGELSGYIVLVLESDNQSVELRRISIDQNKRGVGQAALMQVESFSEKKFGVKRIWLDVYEDNAIGRHIYEKLSFEQFKTEMTEGRRLLFYEKFI